MEDVINSLRPDFQSDGIDDSVLNEVRALWESNMIQHGAIEGPIGGNAPIAPVHDLNTAHEGGRQEDEAGATQMPETREFSTGKRKRDEPASDYLSEDRIPQPDGKRRRDDHTSDYLSGDYIPQQDGAGDFSLELAQPSNAGAENQMLSGEHPTDESRTLEWSIIVESEHGSLKIPQVDGVNDNLDDTAEGRNEPTEQAQRTSNNSAAPKTTRYEEPPLNEADDIDEVGQADIDGEVGDLVIALFEKVWNIKTRWKFILKHGTMHLNENDYFFSRATGDLQFQPLRPLR